MSEEKRAFRPSENPVYLKTWDQIGETAHKKRQGALLHRFLKEQVLLYSPFYRELFAKNGISADDIRGLEDLTKIPFTSKADIAPTAEHPAKPRQLVLQPDAATFASTIGLDKRLALAAEALRTGRSARDQVLDEYLPIFFIATTGRTANPTPFLYTARDYKFFREAARRLFTIGGVRRESDFVFNAFPYAPHLAFWIVYQGGIETGTPMFHSGGGKILGTERIIQAIQRYSVTVLVGVPGYVYHILRLAAERGMDYSKVRMVVLGAERVTQGLKKKLKELLESMGAKNPVILSTLGFTEARVAWMECPEGSDGGQSTGYHLYPDMEIIEIVNPDTGAPCGEGESGELVYTALDWRGSVAIRYRTGDFVRGGMTWKPCPGCGRKVPRLSTDITRLSERGELALSKVRGTLVDFNEFHPILNSLEGVLEWQVEITKRNLDPHELDEIHIYLSVAPNADRDRLVETLQNRIHAAMELNAAAVHFLPPEELAVRLGLDDRPKECRIVDRRPELEQREGEK